MRGASIGMWSVSAAIALASAAGCGGSDGAAAAQAALPAPSLVALSIDGLTMTPAFSPDTHDYAMRCAQGRNFVRVSAQASDGATASIIQPTATPLDPSSASNVFIVENEALVVQAVNANGAMTQYWVRCLPHDFPPMTVKRYGATADGFFMLGNTILPATGDTGYPMVLDKNGTPVWYYRLSTGVGFVALVSKNTIAFPTAGGAFGTDPNGHYRIFHLDTGATTSIATVGTAMDAHEFLPLANGNVMLLAYPLTHGIDLSSRDIAVTDIADCMLQEIAPDGRLVWSWLASEHFDPAVESTDPSAAKIGTTPVLDVFHCNSIEPTPSGDVIVSARHMDAVFQIARATGKVAWKLGGVPQNKDGAQILQMEDDPETSFYHQHDARLVASGNLTLFDDHGTAQGPARGVEIAFDATSGTARIAWQYQAPFSSSAMGSFRRFDDGSAVVGWGLFSATGSAIAISEVDGAGNPLLEIAFDLGDHAYRAVKVPPSSFDLDVLRQSSGGTD